MQHRLRLSLYDEFEIDAKLLDHIEAHPSKARGQLLQLMLRIGYLVLERGVDTEVIAEASACKIRDEVVEARVAYRSEAASTNKRPPKKPREGGGVEKAPKETLTTGETDQPRPGTGLIGHLEALAKGRDQEANVAQTNEDASSSSGAASPGLRQVGEPDPALVGAAQLGQEVIQDDDDPLARMMRRAKGVS